MYNNTEVYCTFGLGREAGIFKLPADVVLGISDRRGARKERVSGGDCFDSSASFSVSLRKDISSSHSTYKYKVKWYNIPSRVVGLKVVVNAA